MKRSIRTQLFVSFLLVMLPVVLFMIDSNPLREEYRHDKVSETYRNTLDVFPSDG